MATLELQEELHRKIDSISNLSELLDLKYSIDWFMADQTTWEEHQVLDRLRQTPILSEKQTGIPHSKVIEEAKTQWLKK